MIVPCCSITLVSSFCSTFVVRPSCCRECSGLQEQPAKSSHQPALPCPYALSCDVSTLMPCPVTLPPCDLSLDVSTLMPCPVTLPPCDMSRVFACSCQCSGPQRQALVRCAHRAGGQAGTHQQPVPHRSSGENAHVHWVSYWGWRGGYRE